MTTDNGLWVLGYGSLIYKPPPHFTHRLPATIHGFERRFWQSSIDHRGTPGAPGRVVTLVPYSDIVAREEFRADFRRYEHSDPAQLRAEDLTTLGVVYYIPADRASEVREYLDVREQNGYTAHEVDVHIDVSPADERAAGPELRASLAQLPVHAATGKRVLTTSVYIGTADNEAFVGPEDIAATASVIATAAGPSGSNYKYLRLLCDALDGMSAQGPDRYLKALLAEVHAHM